jgi:hypothetical protein
VKLTIRTTVTATASHLLSAAAAIGGVLLLLADDAGPSCSSTPLDVTYDVATSCGDGQRGRLHLTNPPQPEWTQLKVEFPLGNLRLRAVEVQSAPCEHDGDAARVRSVRLSVVEDVPAYADATANEAEAGSSGLFPASPASSQCVIMVPSQLGTSVPCQMPFVSKTCSLTLSEAH